MAVCWWSSRTALLISPIFRTWISTWICLSVRRRAMCPKSTERRIPLWWRPIRRFLPHPAWWWETIRWVISRERKRRDGKPSTLRLLPKRPMLLVHPMRPMRTGRSPLWVNYYPIHLFEKTHKNAKCTPRSRHRRRQSRCPRYTSQSLSLQWRTHIQAVRIEDMQCGVL